jgi:hypothetical protein
VGADSNVDATVQKYRDESQKQRTIALANTAKLEGKAEFFLLLTAAGSDAAGDAVKFISGDEKLKSLTDTIRAAKFSQSFPDETPVKILRRGTVTCGATSGECVLVLELPGDVRSVD